MRGILYTNYGSGTENVCWCTGQEALGVPKDIVYESCSDKVADALGPDVMKSVKHLIPDILAALPLLLYQGEAHTQTMPLQE